MTQSHNRVESALLRRINERRLLEVIQQQGPSSRAALTRSSGLTAPTVSKVVDALLKRGLVEEIDPLGQTLGRPGRLVQMAAASAVILGVVIDATTCCVAVREGGDKGRPVVLAHPESETAKALRAIAGKVAQRVSILNAE